MFSYVFRDSIICCKTEYQFCMCRIYDAFVNGVFFDRLPRECAWPCCCCSTSTMSRLQPPFLLWPSPSSAPSLFCSYPTIHHSLTIHHDNLLNPNYNSQRLPRSFSPQDSDVSKCQRRLVLVFDVPSKLENVESLGATRLFGSPPCTSRTTTECNTRHEEEIDKNPCTTLASNAICLCESRV